MSLKDKRYTGTRSFTTTGASCHPTKAEATAAAKAAAAAMAAAKVGISRYGSRMFQRKHRVFTVQRKNASFVCFNVAVSGHYASDMLAFAGIETNHVETTIAVAAG